jgi:hypothetical protein
MGGLLTDAPDTPADAGDGAAVLRTPAPANAQPASAGGSSAAAPPSPLLPPPGVKLAVLKYGTGGVAAQIAARPEIVKFLCVRGTRAIVDLHNSAHAGGGGGSAPTPAGGNNAGNANDGGPAAVPPPPAPILADSQPPGNTPAHDSAAALPDSQQAGAGRFGADD